jgi:hypothetical protein
VWSAVSGGAGLSEVVVAVAERLAEGSRTLLVEANPISATLAARLGRDPAFGLGWTLARVAHGHSGLPEGLSPSRSETGAGLGHFDVVCQTAAPGGPPAVHPAHLGALVDEAVADYDQVLVEVGPVLGASPTAGADRFAAGRALLGRADRVAVLGGPDPEAAARLVEWRAAAAEWGVGVPVVGVFGRVPGRGRFEAAQLTDLVDRSTGAGFAAVHVLPEDPVVGRARWNGELVWRGRWRAAIDRLAADMAAAAPPPPAPAPVRRRVSLASEVGLS